MHNLIKRYIENLTKKDIYDFALSKDILLDEKELDFLFDFVKKDYDLLLSNPNMDLSKYGIFFREENFKKILKLVDDYKIKYAFFLK